MGDVVALVWSAPESAWHGPPLVAPPPRHPPARLPSVLIPPWGRMPSLEAIDWLSRTIRPSARIWRLFLPDPDSDRDLPGVKVSPFPYHGPLRAEQVQGGTALSPTWSSGSPSVASPPSSGPAASTNQRLFAPGRRRGRESALRVKVLESVFTALVVPATNASTYVTYIQCRNAIIRAARGSERANGTSLEVLPRDVAVQAAMGRRSPRVASMASNRESKCIKRRSVCQCQGYC